MQLPLYQPSPEEAADPRLYAANVRDYMLRHSAAVMGPAALQPSAGMGWFLRSTRATGGHFFSLPRPFGWAEP